MRLVTERWGGVRALPGRRTAFLSKLRSWRRGGGNLSWRCEDRKRWRRGSAPFAAKAVTQGRASGVLAKLAQDQPLLEAAGQGGIDYAP
jgi:hypothetical protein